MNEIMAAEVYEIVVTDPSGPKSWFRTAGALVIGLVTGGYGPTNPGGMILSVRRRDIGEELFRHIEDFGDDEGHLLDGLEKDLACMSAVEFEQTWGSSDAEQDVG